MKTIEYKKENYYTFTNSRGRKMIIFGFNKQSEYFYIAPIDKMWQSKKLKISEYNLIEVK